MTLMRGERRSDWFLVPRHGGAAYRRGRSGVTMAGGSRSAAAPRSPLNVVSFRNITEQSLQAKNAVS